MDGQTKLQQLQLHGKTQTLPPKTLCNNCISKYFIIEQMRKKYILETERTMEVLSSTHEKGKRNVCLSLIISQTDHKKRSALVTKQKKSQLLFNMAMLITSKTMSIRDLSMEIFRLLHS